MAAKSVELASTTGCLAKASGDEIIFILRAQDRCAPATVRDWARRARGQGTPEEKVQEAMDCALAMEQWQVATGKVKVPD